MESEILEVIQAHLAPHTSARQSRGEVFTPPSLIETMLDRLPASLWKNPHATWIDPAGGIGNFYFVVFFRLFRSLTSIPLHRRAAHILSSMLYMVEYDAENVRIAKQLVKRLAPSVVPNIVKGDALTQSYPHQFDVVMGNPPFNKGHRHAKGSSRKILEDFGHLSVRLVRPRGWILLVLPQTWRNIYNPLFPLLTALDLQHIHVLTHESFYPYPMDTVLIQNRQYQGRTEKVVGDRTFVENIHDVPRISNGNDRILARILRGGLPVQVLGSFNIASDSAAHMSETRSATFRYPILRNLNQAGTAEENLVYSRIPHPFQTDLKLLLSNGAYLYPTIDRSLGTSQNVYFVLRNSLQAAQRTVRFLQSTPIQYAVQAMKVGRYGSDYRDLQLLPDPLDFPELQGRFSDADVARALGLSQRDLREIEGSQKN